MNSIAAKLRVAKNCPRRFNPYGNHKEDQQNELRLSSRPLSLPDWPVNRLNIRTIGPTAIVPCQLRYFFSLEKHNNLDGLRILNGHPKNGVSAKEAEGQLTFKTIVIVLAAPGKVRPGNDQIGPHFGLESEIPAW